MEKSETLLAGAEPEGPERRADPAPGNPFWVLDLLGVLNHWFWRLDAGGTVTWISDRFTALSGEPVGVLVGRTFFELADHMEPEGDVAQISAVIAERKPFTGLAHSLALGKDRTIWVRTSGQPHYSLDNTFLGYRCVSEDISELVRKERAWRDIARQNQLLAAAIDATQVGVVMLDATAPERPLIYVNAAFTRSTGWTLGSAIGQNLELLFCDDSDPETVLYIRSALAGGHPCTVELLARRRDGTQFWSDLALAPVFSGQQLMAIVGIHTDSTRRRNEESQRQEGQKLEALGHLAGGMAHEINNLLQPVVTFSELAAAAIPATDTVLQRYLAKVTTAALKARDVVRNVLFFARRSGNAIEELNLQQTVEEAVGFVSGMLPATVMVHTDGLDHDHGMAQLNAVEMTQVAANLMMNAAQAMGGRGNIQIRLESRYLRPDEAQALGVASGLYARFCVSDNGPGMDEATLSRIFEPFFTTKPLGEGTGLGLSVVYGVVRHWKGVVDVESVVGKGATFYVYIPRSK